VPWSHSLTTGKQRTESDTTTIRTTGARTRQPHRPKCEATDNSVRLRPANNSPRPPGQDHCARSTTSKQPLRYRSPAPCCSLEPWAPRRWPAHAHAHADASTSPSTNAFAARRVNENMLEISVPHSRVSRCLNQNALPREDISSEDDRHQKVARRKRRIERRLRPRRALASRLRTVVTPRCSAGSRAGPCPVLHVQSRPVGCRHM
jgi:hypothetical protein